MTLQETLTAQQVLIKQIGGDYNLAASNSATYEYADRRHLGTRVKNKENFSRLEDGVSHDLGRYQGTADTQTAVDFGYRLLDQHVHDIDHLKAITGSMYWMKRSEKFRADLALLRSGIVPDGKLIKE